MRKASVSKRGCLQKPNEWKWDARFVDWRSTVDLTPAEAEKHAQYLKKNGVNAVCVSHHNFTVRQENNRQLTPGHHLFYEGSIKEAVVEKTLKIICDACHKYGMKVIEHHSSNYIPTEGEYRGSQFSEWSNVDARTGKRLINNPHAYYPNLACINNQDWWEKYFAYLKHLFKKIDFDGLMHDDIHFNGSMRTGGIISCGCEYCREKFHKETGFRLPQSGNNAIWKTYTGRIWDAFIRFRIKSIADELSYAHKVIGRDKVLFTCNSHEYLANFVEGVGLSQDTVINAIDMSYCEVMSRATFYELQKLAVSRKVFSGRAYSYNKPALMYFYGLSHEEDFFGWALNKTFGLQSMSGSIYDTPENVNHSINVYPGSYNALEINKYYIWEKKHQDIFHHPKPVADIGLLYSTKTIQEYLPKDMDKSYIHGTEDKYFINGWEGWCDLLLQRKTAFEVINDIDLEEDKLSKYRLLILPNAACLTDEQIKNIQKFVRKGGRLIATHHTSLYDTNGKTKKNFGLNELFGVDYQKSVFDVQTDTFPYNEIAKKNLEQYDMIQFPLRTKLSEKQYNRIKAYVEKGGDVLGSRRFFTGEVVLGHRKGAVKIGAMDKSFFSFDSKGLVYKDAWSVVKLRKGAELICRTEKEGQTRLWMVHNNYGKGEVLYFAGNIGLNSFTRGFTKANSNEGLSYPEKAIKYHLWVDTSEKKWQDWMMNLARWGVEDKPYLEFDNTYSGMIINTFQTDKGIVVNFLNTGGKHCKKGFEMPLTHKVIYPSLRKKFGKFLKLKIREKIKQALLISPDFNGKVPINVQYDRGYTFIEIPTNRIHRYTVLLLKVNKE